MKAKRKLLVALLLAAGGIALNAQDGPPPDEQDGPPPREHARGRGQKNIMEELKTELKLSDEQCGKLKPVLDNVKSILEAGRPQGGKRGSDSGADSERKRGSREEMKKKMQEMQAKIQAALEPAKEFLSDEQYKKLKEKFARPHRGRHGKQPGRNNASGDSDKPGKVDKPAEGDNF